MTTAPHGDEEQLPPAGRRTVAKMGTAVRGRDPAPGFMRLLVIFKCPTGCGAIHDHNVIKVDRSYS